MFAERRKVEFGGRRGGKTHKTLLQSIAEYYHGEWMFTGTRAGMSRAQNNLVGELLRTGKPIVLRHGGAIGADMEAHAIWRASLQSEGVANVWPASEDRAAVFRNQFRVYLEPVQPPLFRNTEMVKRSGFILAAPHYNHEELRSGTWHAIRQGGEFKKPTLVVWPSGALKLYMAGYRV